MAVFRLLFSPKNLIVQSYIERPAKLWRLDLSVLAQIRPLGREKVALETICERD